VSRVITSLKSLVELDLFNKLRVWQVLRIVLPLLVHPDRWIRQGQSSNLGRLAALLIAASSFDSSDCRPRRFHRSPSTKGRCMVYPLPGAPSVPRVRYLDAYRASHPRRSPATCSYLLTARKSRSKLTTDGGNPFSF
jgi:hypothetical protein